MNCMKYGYTRSWRANLNHSDMKRSDHINISLDLAIYCKALAYIRSKRKLNVSHADSLFNFANSHMMLMCIFGHLCDSYSATLYPKSRPVCQKADKVFCMNFEINIEINIIIRKMSEHTLQAKVKYNCRNKRRSKNFCFEQTCFYFQYWNNFFFEMKLIWSKRMIKAMPSN